MGDKTQKPAVMQVWMGEKRHIKGYFARLSERGRNRTFNQWLKRPLLCH
jgi:hypothetical protein